MGRHYMQYPSLPLGDTLRIQAPMENPQYACLHAFWIVVRLCIGLGMTLRVFSYVTCPISKLFNRTNRLSCLITRFSTLNILKNSYAFKDLNFRQKKTEFTTLLRSVRSVLRSVRVCPRGCSDNC